MLQEQNLNYIIYLVKEWCPLDDRDSSWTVSQVIEGIEHKEVVMDECIEMEVNRTKMPNETYRNIQEWG